MSAPSESGWQNSGVATVEVDSEDCATLVGDLGNCRDVGDAPQRIGGCFDPDKLRLRSHRGAHRREILHVDEVDTVTEACRRRGQPIAQ